MRLNQERHPQFVEISFSMRGMAMSGAVHPAMKIPLITTPNILLLGR
jgi:hypothetical protein